MTGLSAGVIFDVLDGGLLTTVQDGGRPDWTDLGVPESGAADRWSLAIANLLVENHPGAAALELTLVGPRLAVRGLAPLSIGLAGADLGARIAGGRRLEPGRSHRLSPGDVIEIPGDGDVAAASGARAYLAVPGGIDVPVVLGSRSTCLAAGFGGLDGRALRAGDRIATRSAVGAAADRRPLVRPELVWPDPWPELPTEVGPDARPATLHVLPGPDPGIELLAAGTWRVAAAADRVGIRLDGDPLPPGIAGETASRGVPWGSIQVPPDGRPIVLGVDHQSTGGYRVPAVVISADLPLLGQLRPGDAVRLVAIDRAEAIEALRGRRDRLTAGAAALRDAAGWHALVDSAGG